VRLSNVCTLISEGGLGIRNLLRFNHAFLGKYGFGAMGLRERLGGEWWWTLNMEVHGEGGVLVSLSGCMGWVYGRILGGIGFCCLVLRDLRELRALGLMNWVSYTFLSLLCLLFVYLGAPYAF
jgi:hypothetical protein